MGFLPYPYSADIYTKSITQDESGQSNETWTLDRTIKCDFMPSRGEERLVGRVQNPHSYVMWTDDGGVKYGNQIRNIHDRYSNVVEDRAFNVIGIKLFPGFSKVHHTELNLQAVLE